jgi:ketosteroid isomerase-like protein
MSENLDLVRSIFAAWERGDYRSADWAHPEIEFVVAGGPEPGSWRGLAGLTKGTRTWLSVWEDFHYTTDRYRELDAQRVLVLIECGGRGKTSGLDLGEMRAEAAVLFHVCGGTVTKLVHYWDRDHALADLGLEA